MLIWAERRENESGDAKDAFCDALHDDIGLGAVQAAEPRTRRLPVVLPFPVARSSTFVHPARYREV